MVATSLFSSHLCLCPSHPVLCLRGSSGREGWRRENYAQWDAWWKQFEIEMSMTPPSALPYAPHPSKYSPGLIFPPAFLFYT